MAVLGLRFCARAFSSYGKRGHSSSRCAGLSLSRVLLLQSTGSRRAGSVVVAHGPSCSMACGILPDQGSNPCPLHWQADPQPLHHQGSPSLCSFDGWERHHFSGFLRKSVHSRHSKSQLPILSTLPGSPWVLTHERKLSSGSLLCSPSHRKTSCKSASS